MKLKFILAWIIAPVLTISVMTPMNVFVEGKTYKSSIMDQDEVFRYKKELGEMNTIVKTIDLSKSQSDSINKFDLK